LVGGNKFFITGTSGVRGGGARGASAPPQTIDLSKIFEHLGKYPTIQSKFLKIWAKSLNPGKNGAQSCLTSKHDA